MLAIAGKVQLGGKNVTPEDVIAAVFCMCNRYVDGLATWAPEGPEYYRERASKVAQEGYSTGVSR